MTTTDRPSTGPTDLVLQGALTDLLNERDATVRALVLATGYKELAYQALAEFASVRQALDRAERRLRDQQQQLRDLFHVERE